MPPTPTLQELQAQLDLIKAQKEMAIKQKALQDIMYTKGLAQSESRIAALQNQIDNYQAP